MQAGVFQQSGPGSGTWPWPSLVTVAFLLGTALCLSTNHPFEIHDLHPLPVLPCPGWFSRDTRSGCVRDLAWGSIYSNTLHVSEVRPGGSRRPLTCLAKILWGTPGIDPGHQLWNTAVNRFHLSIKFYYQSCFLESTTVNSKFRIYIS